MTHTTFRVSCKAILYNETGTKVLIAEYNPGNFGLPGGHIEGDETPDEAMHRELAEELGLAHVSLRHGNFIRHRDGKIVLFFYGNIPESTSFTIDVDEISAVTWATLDDIRSGKVNLDMYKDDVLKIYSDV